jgi:glycosyltransferase involved in cell wall biosynthesis
VEREVERKIHVFASDLLPFPGCPCTAGGNRSMQVIKALRSAGHEVTFSMPLDAYLSKAYASRILQQLTAEERWCSDHFSEPDVVLHRIQPDIAIYCNVNCFETVRRFSKETVHILDMYGPLQFEGLLIESHNSEAALLDAALLESRCRSLIGKLQHVDSIVTVSERQKYFWSAYCSMAGFALAEIDVLLCPVAFDIPEVVRQPTGSLTVVYSGGFYPWQNPQQALSTTAAILDSIRGATLHVFGGPHAGLPNEAGVNDFLNRLSRQPSVRYHGYRPVEEVRSALSTAWCALELMERNAERELAITGRTVEFLATGTPVIYNDYSTLSQLISRYNAGWTISPSNPDALRSVFDEIVRGGPELIGTLSANARRLAGAEFSMQSSMAALARLCAEGPRKRGSAWPGLKIANGQAPVSSAVVIAAQPERGSFDSHATLLPELEESSWLHASTSSDASGPQPVESRGEYDAVIVQAGVPVSVCRVLHDEGIPFAIDLGDDLLGTPPATASESAADLEILDLATVIIAVNPRVVRHLERRSGLEFAQKSFIVPGCLPFSGSIRPPAQPSQLILFQQDLYLGGGFAHAIEEFSRKHSLPVLSVGRTAASRRRFTNEMPATFSDLPALLGMLDSTPTSIGIAPLAARENGPGSAQIDAVSDSRMLLFGGFGHCGVYSNGAPYTDSGLQTCGSLAGPSCAEWKEALEYQYRRGWMEAAQHALQIRQARSAAVVARDSWLPALRVLARSRPVRRSEVNRALRYVESAGAAAHGRNGRPSSSRLQSLHAEVQQLQNEIFALRSSMSWRITAPVRILARPLFAAAERVKSAQSGA